MRKKCFACSIEKDLSDFFLHRKMADGHLGKCKACCRLYEINKRTIDARKISENEQRRNKTPARRQMRLEYQRKRRATHPDKSKAWDAVSYAIRSGKLSRMPCEVCGTTIKVQAHHHDYQKPLDVRWLCFKHHREIAHGQTVVAI